MIKASIGAVPGLLAAFLVLAALFIVPVWYVARIRCRPVMVRALFAASVAGIVSVTLLPGNGSTGQGVVCDTGSPFTQLTQSSASTSALLNVALFVPAPFFGVLVFRRPATVAAIAALTSGVVELLQAESDSGRACSVTDFSANTIGALLGALFGVLALWFWRRRDRLQQSPRVGQDLAWGSGVAAVGFLALAGIFHGSVSGYNASAIDEQHRAIVRASAGADEWIAGAAVDVFGKQVQIGQTQDVKDGGRWHLKVLTDRGEITGWWPDRKLERGVAYDNKAEPGTMDGQQAEAVSTRFTQRWFSQDVTGSRETSRKIGDARGHFYQFTYRRYVDGVMMPMRLDVTISAAGRIMGFTARSTPDPKIPKVFITKDNAIETIRRRVGKSPQSAVLLAQKVDGNWHPVWMMGVLDGTKSKDLFLDAVSGKPISPDRISYDDS